jgi:hypothetical protein
MRDPSDDYGKKMSLAVAAVRRMHADVSKLLIDADRAIGTGKVSVFGNFVTDSLKYTVPADCWMAKGVYRLYAAKPPTDETVLDALTARFFDAEERIVEPFLLVGQIKYRLPEGQSLANYLLDKAGKAEKRPWHLWNAYAGWSAERRRPGEVLVGRRPEKKIEWFKVIGVPLYTISSMEHVADLMARVRAVEVDTNTGGLPGLGVAP